MKSIYFLIIATLFITGCSSKKYYEPKDTHGSFQGKRIDIKYKSSLKNVISVITRLFLPK